MTRSPNLAESKLRFDASRGVKLGLTFNFPLKARILSDVERPNLRLLHLGGSSFTESETLQFLLKNLILEDIEFDRITLTKGQWMIVAWFVETLFR